MGDRSIFFNWVYHVVIDIEAVEVSHSELPETELIELSPWEWTLYVFD